MRATPPRLGAGRPVPGRSSWSRSTGWLLVGISLLVMGGGVLGSAIGPGRPGWWLLPALLACLGLGAGGYVAAGAPGGPVPLFLGGIVGLAATWSAAGLLPATALTLTTEPERCTVVQRGIESAGRGAHVYTYLVECAPDGTVSIRNVATTRELDRRQHAVGDRVTVLGAEQSLWRPDTVDSVDDIRGSWLRWGSLAALGMLLGWATVRGARPDAADLPPTHR